MVKSNVNLLISRDAQETKPQPLRECKRTAQRRQGLNSSLRAGGNDNGVDEEATATPIATCY